MTLDELTANIQEYCENYEDTFVTHIPDFIRAAEERINNAVQLPAQRVNVTKAATADTPYQALPCDLLSIFSVAVIDSSSNYVYLLNKDVNFIRSAYPQATTSGVPVAYALFDDETMFVGPTPDDAYTIELHYYALPSSLADAGGDGTTWLSTNFPYALLYAALVDAYIYMKGDSEVLTMYDTRFKEQMGLLKQLGDGKDRQDAYRVGQVKVQVQ